MASEAHDQRTGLLAEIDALREALLERRRSSPYPWDPAPIGEYNRLLERVRPALPGPPTHPPEPLSEPLPGQRLWRTPTDDALDALEQLRAALNTAMQQHRSAH